MLVSRGNTERWENEIVGIRHDSALPEMERLQNVARAFVASSIKTTPEFFSPFHPLTPFKCGHHDGHACTMGGTEVLALALCHCSP